MPGMAFRMRARTCSRSNEGFMGEDRRSNRNRANGNRNRYGARDSRRPGTGRRPQPGAQRSARYSAQPGSSRHASQEPVHGDSREGSRSRAQHSSTRSNSRQGSQAGARRSRQASASAYSNAHRRMSAQNQADQARVQSHADARRRGRTQAVGATADYAPTKYVGRKRGMSRGKKIALALSSRSPSSSRVEALPSGCGTTTSPTTSRATRTSPTSPLLRRTSHITSSSWAATPARGGSL